MMSRPNGGNYLWENLGLLANLGVSRLVSLLDPLEIIDLGLADEDQICRQLGIDYHHFPIRNQDVPWSTADFVALVDSSHQFIVEGGTVLVHCLGGIGRSGLFAIAMQMRAGFTLEDAIQWVSRARKDVVPETAAQRDWLFRHRREVSRGGV